MTYPAAYVPRAQPTIPGGDTQFLIQELRSLKDTLDGVLDMLPQEATSAPTRPKPGMIRRAMSPWRPVGGTADAWVSWNSTTASWALLNS